MRKIFKCASIIALSVCVTTGSIFPSVTNNFANEVEVYAASVNAPVPSNYKAGTITTDKSLKLKFKEEAKTSIYWSFNGNVYVKYDAENPPEIDKNRTVYTYATKNGDKSTVKKYKYKLVPAVNLSVAEGTYDKPQTLKIEAPSGTKIYYTTDGKKPTTKSMKYTKEGITIDKSCTLKLLVKKSGWTVGNYEFTYNIETVDIFDKINDYTSKPLYNTLTKAEKGVYKEIFDGYSSFASKTKDLSGYNVSTSRACEIRKFVISENPQLFWANDAYCTTECFRISQITSMGLYYTDSESDAKKRQKVMQKKAREIIDKANASTSNTFDYVKYLHDAICDMTTYDLGKGLQDRGTAGTDDIFVDGRGLCTAYARAFGYLCQLSDLKCINIEGKGVSEKGTEGHCWNKVCIDGKWYNMDVCWDDQDEPVYGYFCVTDDRMSIDHFAEDIYKINKFSATATKYNYLKHYGYTEYTDANSAYQALMTESAKQIKEKAGSDVTVYYIPSVKSGISKAIDDRLRMKGQIGNDIKAYNSAAYNVIAAHGGYWADWFYTGTSMRLTISLN